MERGRLLEGAIESLDAIVDLDLERRRLALLRRHGLGVALMLFPQPGGGTPEARFPEFADAGEWRPTAISDLAELVTGKRRDRVVYDVDRVVDLATPGDFGRGPRLRRTVVGLAEREAEDARVVPSGCVLFVRESRNKFAEVIVNEAPCAVDSRVIALVPRRGGSAEFLAAALERARSDIVARAGGGESISAKDFGSIVLRAPGVDEQMKLAAFLSSQRELVESYQARSEALGRYRMGLSQMGRSGEPEAAPPVPGA